MGSSVTMGQGARVRGVAQGTEEGLRGRSATDSSRIHFLFLCPHGTFCRRLFQPLAYDATAHHTGPGPPH